jgi:hypothetical protein
MLQYPTDMRLLPDEKPTLGFEFGLCGWENISTNGNRRDAAPLRPYNINSNC